MNPEQATMLMALAERMALRDLAALAAIRAEQGRLIGLAAVQKKRAEAERLAVKPDADLIAHRILSQFLGAAGAQQRDLIAKAEALSDQESFARRAAERAVGRKRGIELLAGRAARAHAGKAARAEERTLFAVAAVQAALRESGRDMKPAPDP